MAETMCCFQIPAFGQDLRRTETPVPTPTGSEVLLRVLGCGVCHSDLHLRDGYFDLGEGRKLNFNGIHCPFTPGHEVTGTIVEGGPEAGAVSRGQKVLAYAWIGCGQCERCLAGQENLCSRPGSLGMNRDGGYADYVIVPHPRYLIDIEGLDPVAAAPLGCSGLTTYSALQKFGPDVGSTPTVIIGAGGLGLMALGVLQRLGSVPPVVVDIDDAKLEAALAAGASAAINPRTPDASKRIRAAVGRPIRQVLDLVGSSQTVRQGLDLLGPGGKLVIVGLLGGELKVPAPILPLKSITVQGSYVGSLAELRDLVALMRKTGLPPMPVDQRPLKEAPAALADLSAGRIIGRAVLVPA